VAWLFYTGDEVVAWSGVLDNGPVNFVLPLLVSLEALDAGAFFWRCRAAESDAVGDEGCCGGCWRGRSVEDGNADAAGAARWGRGALRVACPLDPHDRANSRTSVWPLPKVRRRPGPYVCVALIPFSHAVIRAPYCHSGRIIVLHGGKADFRGKDFQILAPVTRVSRCQTTPCKLPGLQPGCVDAPGCKHAATKRAKLWRTRN
jgi:hypothetical protein